MNSTMTPEAIYKGTLQLKAFAEEQRTVCAQGNLPDQAANWTACITYFEDQLDRLRLRMGQASPDVKTGQVCETDLHFRA